MKQLLLLLSGIIVFCSCSNNDNALVFDEKTFAAHQAVWETKDLQNYSFRYEFNRPPTPEYNVVGYVTVKNNVGSVKLVDPRVEAGFEPLDYTFIDSTSPYYLTSMDEVFDAIYATYRGHKKQIESGEIMSAHYRIDYDQPHSFPTYVQGLIDVDGKDYSNIDGAPNHNYVLRISNFVVDER